VVIRTDARLVDKLQHERAEEGNPRKQGAGDESMLSKDAMAEALRVSSQCTGPVTSTHYAICRDEDARTWRWCDYRPDATPSNGTHGRAGDRA